MAASYPVVLIHTAPFCPFCKEFLSPPKLSAFTKLIHDINPRAQIKVVSHEYYNKTNKEEQYPPFDYIPRFPMIMVTDSSNCHRKGTMDKVKILGHKWDGKAIVETTGENTTEFLKKWLGENKASKTSPKRKDNSQKSAPISPPRANLPVKTQIPPKPALKSKSERRQFRLVGEND